MVNKELPEVKDGDRQIRCSNCGRFLGYGQIKDGEVYLLCKNCKMWTGFLGTKQQNRLTKAK